MTHKHHQCPSGLFRVAAIAGALTLASTGAASAQTYKQQAQQVGMAAVAIAAYEKSASQCYYEPAVGRAFAALSEYFSASQTYLWEKAKREAPYALNGMSNMAQVMKGQVGEMDCKAYGTLVGNGLFLTLAVTRADPAVMQELDRLGQGGGRPRAGAGASSSPPATGSQGATSAYETGSFPISAKDVGATIKELKGVDTPDAYMAGTVTRGDAAEYCTRDPGGMTVAGGGKLTHEQCVTQILNENGSNLYQVRANCQIGRVDDLHGRMLTLVEAKGDGSSRTGIWKDQMGVTFDSLSDPRITILEMQFGMMCPARWKGQQSAVAPAQGQRRNFEGVWAQTEAECLDEEGPNTRTLIDLKNPKVGALFEGYENVCRINRIEGQNPAKLHMTCFEFWQYLEANEAPHQTTVTIAALGPQSISLNGRPYLRCLK